MARRAIGPKLAEKELESLSREVLNTYQELNLLYRLSERLGMQTNQPEIAAILLDEAFQQIPARRAAIWMLDAEGRKLKVITSRGLTPDPPVQPDLGLEGNSLGEAIRKGIPVLINETAQSSRASSHSFLSLPLLIVPMRLQNEIIGAISLSENLGQRKFFTSEDQKCLTAIANQGALALKRTFLFEDLKQAGDQIRALHREKESLLCKTLQTILSLMNLQSREIQDPEILHVLRESQNRIRALTIVHGEGYQVDEFDRVNMAAYIRDLVRNLYLSYGVNIDNIPLQMEVKDIFPRLHTVMLCGLLINELVSNAFQHAFPGRGGKIYIGLRDHPGQMILTVRDDGVGIPEEVPLQNPKTLGLKLVTNFVNQLNGKIEFHRSGGTEVQITFPQENPGGRALPEEGETEKSQARSSMETPRGLN